MPHLSLECHCFVRLQNIKRELLAKFIRANTSLGSSLYRTVLSRAVQCADKSSCSSGSLLILSLVKHIRHQHEGTSCDLCHLGLLRVWTHPDEQAIPHPQSTEQGR